MKLLQKIRKMSMLLIDDDQWVRDSLRLFFECEGCTLETVATAEEAMQALKDQPYDIIITDYQLPGMSGLNFLEHIQRHKSKAIRILISAYKNNDINRQAIRAGIDDFIEKPFNSDTILDSLARALAKHSHPGHDDV